MHEFMFATGIENSYPTIALPDGTIKRRDEMDNCGHYKHWKEDFRLVKQTGVEYLRYGPPYYKCHVAPGKYDWSFPDETFHALRQMQIQPIADLCHFGLPDWVEGGFQNADWPAHFAEYAGQFARRYPWVTRFTPVNEIFVAACFSGLLGWWNERLTTDRGFVTAMKNLCKANLLAMHAILKEQPDATFIQSESSEYFHVDEPCAQKKADFFNQRRFLSLDLTYGHDVGVCMYQYLIDNGMTRQEYDWFGKNHLRARCVMGNDYYITNEHMVKADGSVVPSGEIFGYYVITHQYYQRYHLPVMHTETNVKDADAAPQWLYKEWANMRRLREDGVPILGFTWYSLTDQKDWDTALREYNNNVNDCGLYDLSRNVRPVGDAYRDLIRKWCDILPTMSSGLRVTHV